MMSRSRWRLILLMLVLAHSASAEAQAPRREHATITLLAEDDAFKAGQTAWVGLQFEMEPGWHIYWINPGDAGDPPRVKWDAPSGFVVGDFRWPTPVRLVTGPVVDYGYEGRVLLAAPVTVPASHRGATPPMSADIRYVICREVCISATARVSLTSELTAVQRKARFADARARWPKALPSGWTAMARRTGAQVVLTVEGGTREISAQFFPLTEGQIDNVGKVSVTPTPRGLQLTLSLADPDAPPTTIRGVIVLPGDRAFTVEMPLPANR